MVRPVGLWMAIALGLSACGSASEAVPMTRDRCEAQPGFVFVPGGEFIAGSDQTERDYGYAISAQAIADSPAEIAAAAQRLRDRRWFELEGDRRRESLAAFCLQTHLVTQQDYAEFVTATAHRSPGITAEEYQTQGFLVHPYADVVPYLWREGQFPEGLGEHPVVLVSYDDALAYAQWRGEQDGGVYRLPTAAEWEKNRPHRRWSLLSLGERMAGRRHPLGAVGSLRHQCDRPLSQQPQCLRSRGHGGKCV